MENRKRRSVKHIIIGVVIVTFLVGISFITARNLMVVKDEIDSQMENHGEIMVGEVISNLSNVYHSELIMDDLMNDQIEIALESLQLMDIQSLEGILESGTDTQQSDADGALDEINFISSSGEIIYSNLSGNIGEYLDANHPVMEMLKSGEDKIIEEVRQSTTDSSYYKYGAVRIGDLAVQVGINADAYMDFKDATSMQQVLSDVASRDDVRYAQFVGSDAIVSADSTNLELGTKVADDKITKALTGETVTGLEEDDNYGLTYEVNMPIVSDTGEVIGVARLGLSMDETTQAFSEILKGTLVQLILTLVAVSALLSFIISKLLGPLKSAELALVTMEKGDFSVTLSEKDLNRPDEFGSMMRALNAMKANLQELIRQVKVSGDTMMHSSHALSESTASATNAGMNVAQATDQIAQMASEQAQGMTRLVEDAHVLGEEIQTNSTLAMEAYGLGDQARDKSDEGLVIVRQLLNHNLINNEKSEQVTDVIGQVQNYVAEAESIIEIINNIASQTNLLALNASIEAARAGESGRGFAVVADEIRKLSDETSKATMDIEQLIKNIQGHTNEAVKTIDDMNEIVKTQNLSIEDTSAIFTATSEAVNSLIEKLSAVENRMTHLSESKDGMVVAMDSISSTIQETSASTQEVSSSMEEQMAMIEEVDAHAESARVLSEELDKLLSKFKID